MRVGSPCFNQCVRINVRHFVLVSSFSTRILRNLRFSGVNVLKIISVSGSLSRHFLLLTMHSVKKEQPHLYVRHLMKLQIYLFLVRFILRLKKGTFPEYMWPFCCVYEMIIFSYNFGIWTVRFLFNWMTSSPMQKLGCFIFQIHMS